MCSEIIQTDMWLIGCGAFSLNGLLSLRIMDEDGLVKTDVDLRRAWTRFLDVLREKRWETEAEQKKSVIYAQETQAGGLCCHRFNGSPRAMVVAKVAAVVTLQTVTGACRRQSGEWVEATEEYYNNFLPFLLLI